MNDAYPMTRDIVFDNNRHLPLLYGEKDKHLHRIASVLQVTIHAKGNHVWIEGHEQPVKTAHRVLSDLYNHLQESFSLGTADVEAALRCITHQASFSSETKACIAVRHKMVTPRTPGQEAYIQALQTHDMVFGIGPAGTGKTFLAVAAAVSALLEGKVKRIILSRPAVEAGERLGFLPGDLKDKIDPYLRPLYDALFDLLPGDQLTKRFDSGEIEVAPLAFMRGRTLSHAFVILDEAQNTTDAQMKMFLTRLGPHARMVITGDITQVDLPQGMTSGLRQAEKVLKDVSGLHFSYFKACDVVRHPLVERIVKAYESSL